MAHVVNTEGGYNEAEYIKQRPQISPGSLTTSADVVGTVLVKPNEHQAARLPLAGRLGLVNKNMFSPLKLETMFEPPTPRITPSDDIIGADDQPPFQFNNKPNQSYPFTFSKPHIPPIVHHNIQDQDPDSTKLKLFQFQYDAYTRDHLSALIESIPLDSSSRTASTPSARKRDSDDSHVFRPHKRIKISPLDEDEVIHIKARPTRSSLPAPATKKDQTVRPTIRAVRSSSNTSQGGLRSNASSTVNATESLHSLSAEELASKMRQVALVSTGSEEMDRGVEWAPLRFGS